MKSITIRINLTALVAARQPEAGCRRNLAAPFPDSEQATFANHIRQATVMLGQGKLIIRRAAVLADDHPDVRHVLDSLATELQIAIETAQKLVVSR